MTVEGWAVRSFNGKLNVRSVGETRRAAIVNWLLTERQVLITRWHSDEEIEMIWQGCNQYFECVRVHISPAPRAILEKAS